ncbi:arylsulfatase [Flexithrix dorotheae]|uniref:arylsulfatase n=1 Tax=Flexithrix dorotheae TaxID=70993 RepID=UPI00036B5274|nr:arylsulfatase [Flexithrix dorotheae]
MKSLFFFKPALLCILVFTFSPFVTFSQQKPNIVLVITDDQGYGDLSCHGNPWINTPNMDRLFQESTRLTDFHVSPTCAPTRAALLTGHYANRTGVWHTIAGRSLIKESEKTLANILQENGYKTGIFGKWHLGDNIPFRPQDKGFDEVLIHGGGGVGQGPDYWDNDYFDDTYFHNGKAEKFQGYCTDVWFDNAIKFIDKWANSGQPFFTYIATNAPHGPYYVENKYLKPYNENPNIPNPSFYGMIENADENLGKLMNYLERNNLEDNTIFIFMTDNGTSSGIKFKGNSSEAAKGFNAGMRGQKGSMYEGGHRVPFFIKWPAGNIPENKDINELTAHIDLVPTLIDMLSLKNADEHKFDGISLKNILLEKEENLPPRTIITDSQRLETPEKWRQSATMKGTWRLVNGKELYDISKDPGQDKDVAKDHPQMVKDLRSDYEKWWADLLPGFKESPAITICPPQQPTTLIFTHDMHMDPDYNSVAWNHKLIREGMKAEGWYEIQVPEEGKYKFTLHRWPPELNAEINSSVPKRPSLPITTVDELPAGKILNLQKAGFSADGKEMIKNVNSNDTGVTFEVSLAKGNHQIRAWFENQNLEKFGAYYIMVSK